MGKKALTIEYISEYAKSKGCDLLSTEYKNINEKLEFRYNCGHSYWSSFSSFKLSKSNICRKCCGTERKSIEDVRKVVKEKGCELLSDTYISVFKKLRILFSCGHEGERNLQDFIRTKGMCSECLHIQFYEFVDMLKNNNLVLFGEKPDYFSSSTMISYVDEIGYKYYSNYSKTSSLLKAGSLPVRFGISNPYSMDNLIVFLRENNSKYFVCDGEEWTGTYIKINLYDKDGFLYNIKPNVLMNNIKLKIGLAKYDKTNIHTLENVKTFLKNRKSTYFLVDGQTFTGTTTNHKLEFVCSDCPDGEIPFKMSLAAVLAGQGCPLCSGRQIGKRNNLEYLYPEIASEFSYDLNPPCDNPSHLPPMSHKKIWWTCSICGENYISAICDRTGRGNACPHCKSSKGEKRIAKHLGKEKIGFAQQYKLKDCGNIRPYPFDFYIPRYNVAIEFGGKQHYTPIKFFGGQKSFEDLQHRDKIKSDYCKSNSIKLITIPYWDFNNIETILSKELNI